jgi:FtsP/CotA-like multicopper oxidase with cupredoxin domain
LKSFILNRHGSLVLPQNLFPETDFCSLETRKKFAAVVKRDLEQKAPTRRDLLEHKRPVAWRHVPKKRADLFLPALRLAPALLILASIPVGAAVQPAATGSSAPPPVPLVADPCPRRFAAGDVVQNPPALFSSNGVLSVRFSYQHRIDAYNRELFCFMTPDGLQNPTLHVNPGDHLTITVTNNTPALPLTMLLNPPNCGASSMGPSSLNLHYHGTNTSPTCHSDEVIKTIINSGATFQYDVAFPADEPPGLYWYHPHVHGQLEQALQGGVAGAIVVDGIENVQPAVSGLRQQILIVRDQAIPGAPAPGGNIPSWDVTLNYVPVLSPADPGATDFVPATLQMQAGEQQLWRVSNSSADTILDLQYVFDGVPQTLQLVAIDGVPVNSQDGAQPGQPIPAKHFRLPPAARVEFIVAAPPASVQLAQLMTLGIDTGPTGDNDPQRPLASIKLVAVADGALVHGADAGAGANDGRDDGRVGLFSALNPRQRRFAGLSSAPVAVRRTLYFDEKTDSSGETTFFMASQGQPEQPFDPNAPASIVATQGTAEEWTVENHTAENHEFHVHQLHFLVESQNNFKINGAHRAPGVTGQYLDTVEVPYWDQNPSHPFPNVKLLVDFRGPDIGNFVYHCHIAEHEDHGMMSIIDVRPPSVAGKASAIQAIGASPAVGPLK